MGMLFMLGIPAAAAEEASATSSGSVSSQLPMVENCVGLRDAELRMCRQRRIVKYLQARQVIERERRLLDDRVLLERAMLLRDFFEPTRVEQQREDRTLRAYVALKRLPEEKREEILDAYDAVMRKAQRYCPYERVRRDFVRCMARYRREAREVALSMLERALSEP
jgi:tryptophan 2,3-dioxygenase